MWNWSPEPANSINDFLSPSFLGSLLQVCVERSTNRDADIAGISNSPISTSGFRWEHGKYEERFKEKHLYHLGYSLSLETNLPGQFRRPRLGVSGYVWACPGNCGQVWRGSCIWRRTSMSRGYLWESAGLANMSSRGYWAIQRWNDICWSFCFKWCRDTRHNPEASLSTSLACTSSTEPFEDRSVACLWANRGTGLRQLSNNRPAARPRSSLDGVEGGGDRHESNRCKKCTQFYSWLPNSSGRALLSFSVAAYGRNSTRAKPRIVSSGLFFPL